MNASPVGQARCARYLAAVLRADVEILAAEVQLECAAGVRAERDQVRRWRPVSADCSVDAARLSWRYRT